MIQGTLVQSTKGPPPTTYPVDIRWTDFDGFLTDFNGFRRISTDFDGFQRILTDFDGFQQLFDGF